jgi:light-regulated signal transduction histidine kinase (bacteriophytochrome)
MTKILIVDDDECLRSQLQDLMVYAGYEVAEADNGKEALAMYISVQPDLVLLDAMMPVMDGFECCAQMQALPNIATTPILMMTALADEKSVDRAFAAGVSDYISKPIHFAVLRQRVSRLLETNHLIQELQRQNRRSQLFADLTLKIRTSLQIEDILQTTVTEVQKFLQADRILMFKLLPDGSGTVVQEAVLPGLPVVLGKKILDTCFSRDYIDKYRQGKISAIQDIQQADIQACHKEFLQQFAVQANLVVPILIKEEVWGLLIAHQCNSPRQWSPFELDLLKHLANQIGIALAQAQLLESETRQRQELARSNAELQQFASVASHDLQEPLRKIQAFGNRLKATSVGNLTDQGLDYLERMQNAAQRMQSLIDDLLTLSRVTTQAQPFKTVNLTTVAVEVISDLEELIRQTDGRVELEDLPTIQADPIQMRQLLQNLIGNALKFHRPGVLPIVNIYYFKSKSAIAQGASALQAIAQVNFQQIVVEDNGIGFEEKYLDRIFNVFQRLHSRNEYSGTGVGLAICRKIAERHGGDITATSQLGKGSKFIVTLPMNFHD